MNPRRLYASERMIIIVEGPDGAGKTTLCRDLVHRYNLLYNHEGPPPVGVEPLQYYGKLLNEARGRNIVFDRLAMGELVYGPILRGQNNLGVAGWKVFQRLANSLSAFQILCRPAYEVCLESWRSGRPELIVDEQKFKLTYEAFKRWGEHSYHHIWTDKFALPHLYEAIEILASFMVELPPGVIGHPNAEYLFVGDIGSNPMAIVDLPFFSTQGSSQYLTDALALAGFPETKIAFMNAYSHGRAEPNVIPVESFPKLKQVIALGTNASIVCQNAGIIHTKVPHPQYYKRFHYAKIEEYAQVLTACRRFDSRG